MERTPQEGITRDRVVPGLLDSPYLDPRVMAGRGLPNAQSNPRAMTAAASFVPGVGDAIGLLSDAAGYVQDPASLTPGRGLLSLAALIPGIPRMKLWHGTDKPFKEFSDFQPNFLTSSKEYASGYAGKFGKQKGAILEVEADIRKPFDTANDEARRIYNEEFIPFAKREFGDESRYQPLSAGQQVPFTTADALWAFLRRKARESGLDYDGMLVKEHLSDVPASIVPLKASQAKILP